jgi:predicted CoA-binding protein
MEDEKAKKRAPEHAPVLPPADKPAIAPSGQQAIAPTSRPALSGSNVSAIAPASTPAPLPESGQLALPEGKPQKPDPQRQAIDALLRNTRTIAVVGASDKPGKPSHRVTFYLMHAGFEVYPVNPTITELGGRPAFPDLRTVPVNIDIVDVFRRPEQVGPVVDEAIAVGAKAVWMQEGIVNEEAAAKARAAGLVVIMDRCVMKEHRRMLGLA